MVNFHPSLCPDRAWELVRRWFCVSVILINSAITVVADVNLPVIFENASVSGEFRTLFFQRDFKDGSVDQEDFAAGGKLRFETGDIQGVSAGFSIYTAQGMGMNDADKNVYNLLARGKNGKHESYTALGEAYLLGNFGDTSIQIGRQEMRTPWIDFYDIRMTPQSFEAIVLKNKTIPDLQIVAAHVTRMKKRTDTTFQSMSEAAGAVEEKPVSAGGLIFTGIPTISLEAWDYYADDMWNDIYVRGACTIHMGEKVSLFANVRYLDRQEVGDRIAGPIGTHMYGMQGGLKALGAELSFAYSENGQGPILRPWGHDLAVSIQVHVADRAEETAWCSCLKYDFSPIGLKNVSGSVTYGVFSTPDNGSNASPDRNEIDFNVQYDCGHWIKGMNLQIRYAIIHEDETLGGEDFNDFRFYLRCPFSWYPLKKPISSKESPTNPPQS
ncbi:MAG: OprD family outer membrane porin [Pseudomonadota bacterium]